MVVGIARQPPNPLMQPTNAGGAVLRPRAGASQRRQWTIGLSQGRLQLISHSLGGPLRSSAVTVRRDVDTVGRATHGDVMRPAVWITSRWLSGVIRALVSLQRHAAS